MPTDCPERITDNRSEGTRMKAIKLQLANKTLLNPGARQWERAPRTHLALRGTEAAAQPSAYVRTVWAGRRIGAVRSLAVQAAHNRQSIFFRLEWADPTHNADYGDGSAFPDAAAVLFPVNGRAPLNRMGSPAAGIQAWYWRANHPEFGEVLAFHGLATEQREPGPPVLNSARWADGRWQLVIGAPLAGGLPADDVAFAVWEGGNQERAGLHSYTPEWQEITIE
jgi:DMSO reductase family type II enzyme heme b subunit